MSGNLFSSLEGTGADNHGWHVAHCDGGSRGNPGPAGYGAVIEDPEGRVVAHLSEYLGRQTNNYAEYSSLLAVLAWALEHHVRRLRVISDSELMVNQMKGRYKVVSPVLRPLWEEAKRRASRLERFEMRHTLRGGNKEADRLANVAMDKGAGKAVGGPSGMSPRTGASASEQVSAGTHPTKPTRQILDGYVKDGVVHLLEGDLPDGIIVKVIRE